MLSYELKYRDIGYYGFGIFVSQRNMFQIMQFTEGELIHKCDSCRKFHSQPRASSGVTQIAKIGLSLFQLLIVAACPTLAITAPCKTQNC